MQEDIRQQPRALRDLVDAYSRGDGFEQLDAFTAAAPTVLTGMGASFHAALIAAAHLQRLGVPAVALEATDLLFYSRALLGERRPLIYVSQSGTSVEVEPILAALGPAYPLLAVTNNLDSALARQATAALPIHAGPERGVATRSYVNTLALLWLVVRRWCGAVGASDGAALARVADAVDDLLTSADLVAGRWMAALAPAATLVFVGHGPHAATARQAAMMLAERARVAAIGLSVGMFRHGPIEIAQPDAGVVVFASPGPTHDSAGALAEQLLGYGARVLVVEHGHTRAAGEPQPTADPVDEFLSPILDTVPAQLIADALARSRDIPPAFRYLDNGVRTV